jgi:hypothetical protein
MNIKKIAAITVLSLSALPAFANQFTVGEQSAYCSGLMVNAYNITKNVVFKEAMSGFTAVLAAELQNNRISEKRAAFILEGTMKQSADSSKEDLVLNATKGCMNTAVKAGFIK